jgi:hypothetical protein
LAKLLFGATITGMRGTVSGVTFSANKGGPYCKGWSRGVNPSTELQTERRATLAANGAAWQALTPTVRGQWDTYAAAAGQKKTDPLGNDYYASGFNWFCAFNICRTIHGWNFLTTGPAGAPPAVYPITAMTANANPTNTAVVTTSTAMGSNAYCIVSFQLSNLEGRLIPSAANFIITDTVTYPDATNPITFSNLDDYFGPLYAGQRLHCKIQRNNSLGRQNAPTYGSAIVA